MLCKLDSLGLHGITGYPVTAECDLSSGLPNFDIVGLPDTAVKEARERVRSAIRNCGFTFPVSRITVNLAPADRRKGGTLYDLPILVGILCAGGQLPTPERGAALVGELSLSGQVRPVTGMLPMALAAREAGFTTLYVPAGSASEATLAGGLTVYPVENVGPAGRPPPEGGPPHPGAPLDAGTGGGAGAGLRRREGPGAGEAGPGDRRRRRPQPADGGPAGVGQVHAGPAAALHPPRPHPAGGPGVHPGPLRAGPHQPGRTPPHPPPLPRPPTTPSR